MSTISVAPEPGSVAPNDSDFGTSRFLESQMAVAQGSTAVRAVWDLEPGTVAGLNVSDWRTVGFRISKRIFDIVVSLSALLVLAPFLLSVALVIFLYDGGLPIFRQIRVGKDNRRFWFYKFRSMVRDAEARKKDLQKHNDHSDPRTFKMKHDPRITLPGRFIRRFSIDELPQIYNVLIGDMSIVGPRPSLPSEVDLYTEDDMKRLAVKPGLTCIWQVSGRSNLQFPEQVKLDVQYIEQQSFLLDLKLIAKTLPAIVKGDGAV